MCRNIIDWDNEFNDIVWRDCVHPSIPQDFQIACCPDCGLPMLFKETDGKEYVYITIEGHFYKLWTTSKSLNLTSTTFTQ